jgi:curli biogenesis system outer membrane secretion channel CsgG
LKIKAGFRQNKEAIKMLRKLFQVILIVALTGITGCATTGGAPVNTRGEAPVNTTGGASANTAGSGSIYFSGSGGQEMSLAILVPEKKGLATGQDYLPTMVQGEMVANFKKYSRIKVLDRQNLDKILEENESGYYAEGSDMAEFGKILPSDYYLTGDITKTASGYAMQIKVADKANGMLKASYSGTCSIAEFDNFIGIRKASAELLDQMGVKLTDRAKAELAQASGVRQVNAQTALAQGITAQRNGTEVTALSYFHQAAVYDPSLLEAVNRRSVVSANISSGNIGDDARNDIQWRKDWIARLTEIEEFFDNYFKKSSPAFGVFYLSKLDRGDVNYRTETIPLSFQVNFRAFDEWFDLIPLNILQDVYEGLNATKRTSDWGLSDWPRRPVTGLNPFQSRSKNFDVVFELVNSNGKVISSQRLNLNGGWNFSLGKTYTVNYTENNLRTVTFNAVKANDITDNLTIRVAGVNGAAPETATKGGGLQIAALREFPFDFQSRGSVLTGYSGKGGDVVIPDTIWGVPVTTIDHGVFREKGLHSVVIPDSVTSIGASAFESNQLTNVVIPDSVTSIGASAFERNHLTNVVIPDSVTSIGASAFENNLLTNVVIPDSVTSIGASVFMYNNLTNVVIPDSVTSIGVRAFERNQLTNVVIPNSVTSIGASAFEDNLLTNLVIPDSVTSIGGAISDKFTIGANVSFISPGSPKSALRSFESYYNKNGKKAGTYSFNHKREEFQSYYASRQLIAQVILLPGAIASLFSPKWTFEPR